MKISVLLFPRVRFYFTHFSAAYGVRLAYPKSSASDLEGSPSSSEETPESPVSFTGDDVPNRRIRFLRLLNGVGFVCDADAASVSV